MLYYIGKYFFLVIYKVFFKLIVCGAENIPKEGGCILCSNHIAYCDPITVGCAVKRKVNFMAKKELFKNTLAAFVLKKLGAFPVNRGKADIRAVKMAISLLKQGNVFGIFPEGTRNKTGKMKELEPGVALIAIKSKSPLIPVLIKSSYKIFRPIKVLIGQPFELSQYYDNRITSEQLNEISNKITMRYAKLDEEDSCGNNFG